MDPKTPASPPSPVQPASAPPVSPTPGAATIGAPSTVDPSATAAATSSALAGSGEPTMAATSGAGTTRPVVSTDASRLRSPGATNPSGSGVFGDDRSEAMRALLAQNWWALALRGVAAILFGLVAFVAPGATLLSLALVFGAYLLVDGVFGIVAAVKAASRHERWGLLLFEGLVNIVMGVIAVAFPISAVVAFVLVTAAWALLTGGLMIAAAFRLDGRHGRWWLVLGGASSVIFGTLLIVAPLMGAVVLTWWIAAYALVFGALLIGLAVQLRSRRAGATGGSAAARA